MNVIIVINLFNVFKILNINKKYKLFYEFVMEVRIRYRKLKLIFGICCILDKI